MYSKTLGGGAQGVSVIFLPTLASADAAIEYAKRRRGELCLGSSAQRHSHRNFFPSAAGPGIVGKEHLQMVV